MSLQAVDRGEYSLHKLAIRMICQADGTDNSAEYFSLTVSTSMSRARCSINSLTIVISDARARATCPTSKAGRLSSHDTYTVSYRFLGA